MPIWKRRLEDWFESNSYHLNKEIEFEELEADGACKIKFISPGNNLLKINWGNKNHLNFLTDIKNSDGVFLEFEGDKAIALHFVELKRTISLGKWTEVKGQIRGSLKHSLGFLGVLNIPIPNKLVCHTGFQIDSTEQESQAKFADKKPLIGQKMPRRKNETLLKEWLQETVEISQVFPEFEHHKHQLIAQTDGPLPTKKVVL